MVTTDVDQLGILLFIVIVPPLLLVGGIGLLLASLGAKWWLVLIVSLLNIVGAVYLLIRWELLQNLGETIQALLNS